MINTFRKIILLLLSATLIGISFAIAYSNHQLYNLRLSEYFYTMSFFDLLGSLVVLALFLSGIGILILFYIHFTEKAFK